MFPVASVSKANSEARPASSAVGTRDPFPGAKEQPGRDPDHSPSSSAEIKNVLELYLLSTQAPPWREQLCFQRFLQCLGCEITDLENRHTEGKVTKFQYTSMC
jgi:hypothetical protein